VFSLQLNSLRQIMISLVCLNSTWLCLPNDVRLHPLALHVHSVLFKCNNFCHSFSCRSLSQSNGLLERERQRDRQTHPASLTPICHPETCVGDRTLWCALWFGQGFRSPSQVRFWGSTYASGGYINHVLSLPCCESSTCSSEDWNQVVELLGRELCICWKWCFQ